MTTQREEVSVRIKNVLSERAHEFNMQIQDCAITHLEFSKEFAKAVEDKQIAQQDAERAKYLVTLAAQSKKSKIIAAEGEARAAELIGESMKKNPVFAELRRIDAARDIAHVLANSSNRVYLNSDALLVNLMSDFVQFCLFEIYFFFSVCVCEFCVPTKPYVFKKSLKIFYGKYGRYLFVSIFLLVFGVVFFFGKHNHCNEK